MQRADHVVARRPPGRRRGQEKHQVHAAGDQYRRAHDRCGVSLLEEQRGPGGLGSTSKLLAVLVTALWNCSAGAQDPLKDLFPGARLTEHFTNPGTDLFVGAYSRIESHGTEYIALTYYEPYPNSPRLRFVSLALLQRVREEYRTMLDQVATDDGSGLEFQKPFLYGVDGKDLVVFPTCYRGCRYSFFRLDHKPTRVTVEDYVGLDANESFSGRGDSSHFDASGFSTTFSIARPGDAACCPSGGSLNVFYELRGDRFQISRVDRQEAVQETR